MTFFPVTFNAGPGFRVFDFKSVKITSMEPIALCVCEERRSIRGIRIAMGRKAEVIAGS